MPFCSARWAETQAHRIPADDEGIMAFDLGSDLTDRSDAPRRFRPSTDRCSDIPLSPPPSVLAEVDAAFLRAEELRAAGRELHFGLDAMNHRLVIEIRTLR